MKTCYLFGHSDCSYAILPELERRIEKAITSDVTHFYVGNRGSFDQLAITAVKHLKARYPAIRLYLLLAYHPADRPIEPSECFDGTYYPLLEKVPSRYAIVRSNEAMLRQVDAVICYVNHPGNTRKLLSLAQKRREKGELMLDNVAQMD